VRIILPIENCRTAFANFSIPLGKLTLYSSIGQQHADPMVEGNFEKRLMLSDRLCGPVARVPGYITEMYCASCEVRTKFIYVT
jgi:hypothetical protein